MFRYLFYYAVKIINRRVPIVPVAITPTSHCCGIYQMRGVATHTPRGVDLESLIAQTHYVGRASRIIQFSDTGSGGDAWRDYIIKSGYQCDKFSLGLNPKTNNKLYLYHWYTMKDPANAKKLSMTREYSYEEEQKERAVPNSESGGVARAGTQRGPLGRFIRRIR